MKKLITLLIILTLSNCEFKPKETQAQASSNITKLQNHNSVIYIQRINLNEMEYAIIRLESLSPTSNAVSVQIINLTLDQLKLKQLNKQLSK